MREVLLPDDAGVPAPLPAPALGRPAAARRPRHGVRLPAAGDRARRADDRPRRDHPGPRPGHRPRARAQPTASAALYVTPRPRRRRQARRPRRRHVRRPHRRGGRRPRRSSTPPRTRTPAGCSPPIPDITGAQALVGIPGRAPSPGHAAGGLLVRAALRPRHRRVPRPSSRRWSRSSRATGALHPRGRGAARSARPSRPAPPTSRRRRPRTRCWSLRGVAASYGAGADPARHRPAPRAAASAWPWSASRARARRRSPARIAGLHARVRPARSCSRRARWRDSARGGRERRASASASSTSSRTRTARSTRGSTVGESWPGRWRSLGARPQGGAARRWARCSSACR